MHSILLIDDDQELAGMLAGVFVDLGYKFEYAENGERGLEKALAVKYDVVILDVNMPKVNGFDVLKKLRQENSYIPVLMLTSNTDDADKVVGLELGADDYLTKPFKLPELRARVRAILRRVEMMSAPPAAEAESDTLIFGSLVINPSSRRVEKNGTERALTPLEFDMLTFLASNPGKVFGRDEIIAQVWGYSISEYDASINSLIRRLRQKIEDDPIRPKYIVTVRGIGYRFITNEELVSQVD